MRAAVIGLGRMGTAIAERLLAAGHELTVANRTPGRADALVEAGAREVAPDAGVWEHADVVITMLADSAALERVALGDGGGAGGGWAAGAGGGADTGGAAGAGAGGTAGGLATAPSAAGRTLVDMSTVSAESSARVAEAAAASGLRYVRAPVSGNPGVVRAGKLGMVCSGAPEDIAAVEPLLRDIGPNVFDVGEGEAARIMKLALNLMVAGTTQLLAEAVVLAESHGIDRAKALEVIGGSAIASPFVQYKSAPLLERNYESTFTTALMRKDLDLAIGAGADGGVPLSVTATVQQLLQGAMASGMADIDFMALLPRLQREAGQQPDV